VRARLLLALGVVGIALAAAPVRGTEQRIVPLNPPEEQRVERIGGADDVAHVESVDGAADQDVAPAIPPSQTAKAASTAGKVVLSVAAAGLALGAMAASLMFL
jgi:hypothetical protein